MVYIQALPTAMHSVNALDVQLVLSKAFLATFGPCQVALDIQY